MIPRVAIVEPSFRAPTMQERLDELLHGPMTRDTLRAVRSILRDEQQRALAAGEGDTAENFVVLHRGKGLVECVSVEAFHEMVIVELHEHPMALDHCEPETFVRIARGFGWQVE